MSHTEAKTTVNYRQHQQQFKLLTNFQLPMVAQTHRAGSTPAILGLPSVLSLSWLAE